MQGFNMGRYRPPEDLDAALSAAPSSKRLRTGPVQNTVRFEMPFAIWCTTCPSTSTSALIGQGVRFNAVKKKVGNYFSTPVWSFRMKHTPCSSWLELRTDPKNSDFEVTEGARKRDYGDDAAVAERSDAAMISRIAPSAGLTEEEERKRQDAFVAFEGKAAEKIKTKNDSVRIDELKLLKDRDWRDPDAAGKKARDTFRVGRRARQVDGKRKEEIIHRSGLGIELLDATEGDAKRASLVEFGAASEAGSGGRLDQRPFLGGVKKSVAVPGQLSSLQEELASNTRAAVDPFSGGRHGRSGPRAALGIKRKARSPAPVTKITENGQVESTTGLVDYDSD